MLAIVEFYLTKRWRPVKFMSSWRSDKCWRNSNDQIFVKSGCQVNFDSRSKFGETFRECQIYWLSNFFISIAADSEDNDSVKLLLLLLMMMMMTLTGFYLHQAVYNLHTSDKSVPLDHLGMIHPTDAQLNTPTCNSLTYYIIYLPVLIVNSPDYLFTCSLADLKYRSLVKLWSKILICIYANDHNKKDCCVIGLRGSQVARQSLASVLSPCWWVTTYK